MKRKGIIALVFALVTFILGIFGIRRSRKQRKAIPKLVKGISEDEVLMKRILENQEELKKACDDSEKVTQETLALLEELKARLNVPDIGIDPREIDTDLPLEEEVV